MRRMPKHGAWVTAPDGRRGTVVSVTPLTEAVRVRFGNDESFEFAEFPMSDLSYEKPSGGDRDGNNNNGGKPGNNGNAGPNKKKNRDKKFRNKDKRPNDAPQE